MIEKIAFDGGMYGQHFSTTSPEFGTNGTYAKCWHREEDGKIYAVPYAVEGYGIIYNDAILKQYFAMEDKACLLYTSMQFGAPFVPFTVDTHFLSYDTAGIKKTERVQLPELAAENRTLTKEDAASLTMDEAAEEANRCMNCGCYSVNASDISPVLVAFNGKVITNKKEIAARDFFTTKLKAYDMLEQDELVVSVEIPDMTGYITGYEKMRIRESIDFALVSIAYAYKLVNEKITEASLVLGGVAPVPVKLVEVEELIVGKAPSEELAREAGRLAIKNAIPMSMNRYKVNTVEAIVARLVAAM